MTTSLQKFLIAQVSYSLVYIVLFFILFVRKLLKLDALGQNHQIMAPATIRIKFSILVAVMILYSLHIVLAYCDPSYWLYEYPNFSLISLLFILNFSMQLYIIKKEVTKCQQKFIVNVIFWSVCLGTEVIQIVAVEILLPTPNATVIVQILICLCYISLILITTFFERHSGDSNKEILIRLRDEATNRSMEASIKRAERIKTTNRLYIEFNREFQVIQRGSELVCELKIAVYLDENVTIIKKTDKDFMLLSEQMMKTFPSCPEMTLPMNGSRFSNLLKFGEEKQRCFESYLIELTRTDQYYTPYLLEFLEIPANIRNRLIKINTFNYVRNDSGGDQEDFKIPFFNISYLKNNAISVSNPDILELTINKTHAEILQFHNRLISQKRLNIEILSDPPQSESIIHFIDLIVNKKTLWRSFSAWLGLGNQLQNKIYSYFDVWNIGFRSIAMQIIGHEIMFDRQGKMHTMYLLSISKKLANEDRSQSRIIRSEGTTLKKRYSDFFVLDKHIHKFLDKNKISSNLPNLPPKFSPFGNKTSPKSRQVRFDNYMKELLKIDGINHCIKFLQFLQVDVPRTYHIYENTPEKPKEQVDFSERSYFSDLEEKRNS